MARAQAERETERAEPGMVINIGSQAKRFTIGGSPGEEGTRYVLKPGQTAILNPNYSKRRPSAPGTEPRPSIIELMTGGDVVSVEDPRAASAVAAAGIEVSGGGVPVVELPAVKRKRNKRQAEESEDSDIGDLDEVVE